MTETTRVEWGRQPDCEAEGCDPPHSDANQVFPWHTRYQRRRT